MKKYACLDSTNSVTEITELNIIGGERIEGVVAYIQVTDVESTPGIYPIPSVGQVWDGLTLTFN
jgi:hypothetical protein